VIVEATFKLRPLPEVEQFIQARCGSIEKAARLIESVTESEVTPVVLDLHNVGCGDAQQSGAACVVLGFAGTREEVDWQMARAGELGLDETSTLGYEQFFWNGDASPYRLSVRSSCTAEAIRELAGASFVARAGNGVIYYRGSPPPAKSELPIVLMRRVKEAFDPKHILPELPL
jgi:FAD/FMN-containing dehydrogenase